MIRRLLTPGGWGVVTEDGKEAALPRRNPHVVGLGLVQLSEHKPLGVLAVPTATGKWAIPLEVDELPSLGGVGCSGLFCEGVPATHWMVGGGFLLPQCDNHQRRRE